MNYSTAHLDYLQRCNPMSGVPSLDVNLPVVQRGMWHIEGIGQASSRSERPSTSNEQPLYPTAEALIGLYGYRLPVAFLIVSTSRGVSLNFGLWLSRPLDDAAALARIQEYKAVLRSLLSTAYPELRCGDGETQLSLPPKAGICLGVPSSRHPDGADETLPYDRLIRSMTGTNWAALVLAQPVFEQRCAELRDALTNEIRNVQTEVQDQKAPSPLANQYVEALTLAQKSYTSGLGSGMWRTGVYLLGSSVSYPRLASVWRGVFSGEPSLLEAVRTIEMPQVSELASRWLLPNDAGEPGPGFFRHPYKFQTMLTSAQLALYAHLPRYETNGFGVHKLQRFDVVPPLAIAAKPINLGNIVEHGEPISSSYIVEADSLSKHLFIAGVTGSGKTNSVFLLLKEVAARNLPFLVIEPAKTEYRALLNDEQLGSTLRVFTLGNERVCPLRLNPFEVIRGRNGTDGEMLWPIALHLDLLRSVFSVSFGMWNPLPQVLERCLYEIYEDRGWDISSGRNRRLEDVSDVSDSFPNLTDLLHKVETVTGSLGYQEKIASDIRAALQTRINSLRTGGKGRMLDVAESTNMEELLSARAVLELEGLGDDDDKAFVMALLFIRLTEYRRAQGQFKGLRHLVIIEEAHRLLSNVSSSANQEDSNPRGKAVETFAGILSEIRSYGQGIVIADQVPVRLAPDVIKNTNLKIAHRVVAADDRSVLGGSMAMTEKQPDGLAVLKTGRAAVFSEGDDGPVLVQIQDVKSRLGEQWPTDLQVSAKMKMNGGLDEARSRLLPLRMCVETCPLGPRECFSARRIVENQSFRKAFSMLAQSAFENESAAAELWPEVLREIQSLRQSQSIRVDNVAPESGGHTSNDDHLIQCIITRASQAFGEQRGILGSWSYGKTREFSKALRDLVGGVANGDSGAGSAKFSALALQLHARTFLPFANCTDICKQEPPVCLYRHALAEVVSSGRHAEAWAAAGVQANASQDRKDTWLVCQDAAEEVIQWPQENSPPQLNDAALRASLCFAQQMLWSDGVNQRTQKKNFARIKKEALTTND
jgi:hypothetical protein